MASIRRSRLTWGVAAGLAAWTASAAIADSSFQLDRGPARNSAGQRSAHPFVFRAGVLHRDQLLRWVLDDGTLLVTDDATVWVDEAAPGVAAVPAEGRTVRIMGLAAPGGLQVRHGVLRDPAEVVVSPGAAPEAAPDEPEPHRPQ